MQIWLYFVAFDVNTKTVNRYDNTQSPYTEEADDAQLYITVKQLLVSQRHTSQENSFSLSVDDTHHTKMNTLQMNLQLVEGGQLLSPPLEGGNILIL